MEGVFDEAGIEVSAANQMHVDQAIHQIVGTKYKDCPGTWKKIKQQVMADEHIRQDFINRLKAVIN